MKKKNQKLSLNKMTISNLNNMDKIVGGTGDTDPDCTRTILSICKSCIVTHCGDACLPTHDGIASLCVACTTN